MRKVLWKIVLITVLVLTIGSSAFFAKEVAAQGLGGYVIFIGHVTTDEAWGETHCYGSYYCNVAVTDIIYDPQNLLEIEREYEICYTPQLNLIVCNEVICYGYYYKYGGPLQCVGRICCKEENFGQCVERTQPDHSMGWYVCFRGHVTTNEAWGEFVCYGSYYCHVDVNRIYYDPDGLLMRSQDICYKKQLFLKPCIDITCCGFYYKHGGPLQCVGWICCKYVERPAVGGIVVPVDKFGLLAPYIGLASTILVATAATAIYVKRVKHVKEE